MITTYTLTYALPEPDDTNCLTPRQRRELEAKFIKAVTDAADRQLFNIMTGGYYVPNHAAGGRTFEHAPTRPLLEKKP